MKGDIVALKRFIRFRSQIEHEYEEVKEEEICDSRNRIFRNCDTKLISEGLMAKLNEMV